MKFQVETTGGFAGFRTLVATLDLNLITPAVAEELDKVWKRLRPRLQEMSEAEIIGADFVKYEILVENGGHKDRFEFIDDGSEVAQEMVQFVQQIANAENAKAD